MFSEIYERNISLKWILFEKKTSTYTQDSILADQNWNLTSRWAQVLWWWTCLDWSISCPETEYFLWRTQYEENIKIYQYLSPIYEIESIQETTIDILLSRISLFWRISFDARKVRKYHSISSMNMLNAFQAIANDSK